MPLSPVLAEQSTYPFVRLEEAKQRKAEEGVRIIDLGMGDPKGVPEEPIRRALAEALAPIVRLPPLDVEIEGLVFREVLSFTGIEGGLATNVIPDRVRCMVNFRYAPNRTEEEAHARLLELLGRPFHVLGNSPPARVVTDTPLVRRLRKAGGFALEPKQAWTPVAEFSAHGLDAVNLGPGATRYAHTRDEQVAAPELARTFQALQRFVEL